MEAPVSAPLGPFVTFEGGEEAGKTTQLRHLAGRLRACGRPVVTTREPGGTEGAEAIRRLLLEGGRERWSALAELYLFLAARTDHVERVIRPGRASGAFVLCDRFHDSTRVYQGIAGGLGLELVDRLQEPALVGARPDLTILLDIDPAEALRRRNAESPLTRFDARDLDFHRRVREGFLLLARREPERIHVLDATLPEAVLADEIWRLVSRRFGLEGA